MISPSDRREAVELVEEATAAGALVLRPAFSWGFGFDLFDVRWRGLSRTALGVM